MRRILRWNVPVDGEPHEIGSGTVVHVAARTPDLGERGERVEVWTLERTDNWPEVQVPLRAAQAFATGQSIPDEASQHIGTALAHDGRLVWHVFYMRGRPW